MYWLLLLPSVFARGPPGILPPLTFIAESWYPSNLPTVKPPWRQPGVDINQFRTQEFTDNSVTLPAEEKTTKIPLEFQEDNITEVLGNSTEETKGEDRSLEEGSGSGVVEVKTTLESGETLTAGLREETNEETTTERPTTTMKSQHTTELKTAETTTTSRSQNSTELSQEEERRPFSGEEDNFEVMDRSKKRGEGSQEKKKDRKECSELIFAIDSSGNVVGQYEKQKNLVRFILLSLGHQKRRLGLVTYASRRKQRWNISPNHNVTRELYLKKLRKARFLGGVTATGAVLQFLAKETANSQKTTVVLLTDGFSFDEVVEEAELLRSSNFTQLYVTGDYFPIVRPVLNQITGNPEHVFFGHKAIRNLIELLKC